MATKKSVEQQWMELALALATKGRGFTSPNPLVGAVVVKNGKRIAVGYHQRLGGPHAEVVALRKAGKAARGADLYVTLEPCNHFGRTPPCTEAVIQSGVKRVIFAMRDPNPQVTGAGAKRLKQAGIQVVAGLLRKEAAKLNEVFCKYITQRLPWVTLKAAATLDGFIAVGRQNETFVPLAESARRISSPESQRHAHLLRAQHQAILVGVGTILHDDPQLTVRLAPATLRKKQPLKVILDGQLRTPPQAKIFAQSKRGGVLIFTSLSADESRQKKLLEAGAEVIRTDLTDLKNVLKILAKREVSALLVEGGSQINGSFLSQQLVDKLVFYLAPRLLGRGGKHINVPIFNDLGVNSLAQAFTLKDLSVIRAGADLQIEAYPHYLAD
jgi:diaminohydroxyphosphoribosylaminopyrimidine deaminase/5-amino-6-(5-phosphoribosylamino)uracil reductase